MMLIKTELKQLHKEDFIEFMRSVIKVCIANDPEKLKINSFVTDLYDMVVKLDESLLFDTNKNHSEQLEALDAKRDNAFMGIRFGLQMFTYHKDVIKREMARLLLNRLDGFYNDITRISYETDSTIIKNFIGDCTTVHTYKKAIVTLGLVEWISDIEISNNILSKNPLQGVEKESVTERASIRILKPKAILMYKKLINRIKAHSELDEFGLYELVYSQLYTLGNSYREVLSIRSNIMSAKFADEVTPLV